MDKEILEQLKELVQRLEVLSDRIQNNCCKCGMPNG